MFSMRATDGNLGDGTLLNKSFIRNLSELFINTKPSNSLKALIMFFPVFRVYINRIYGHGVM